MKSMSRLALNVRYLRSFSTTRPSPAKNRTYTNIRTPIELSTLLLLSSSSKIPLISLWTASWCSSTYSSLLKSLIEERGVGESQGGVGFVEVEMDAPTIGDLDVVYGINHIPTLLSFSRSEPQLSTKITSQTSLQDEIFLTEWIEKEARRGGEGGAGGSLFDLFGKR